MADMTERPPAPLAARESGRPILNVRAGIRPRAARSLPPAILSLGGVAAAFGAAACCALPISLGLLGLGSTSLLAVAAVAAPYRLPLLVAASILAASGVLVLWRQRLAAAGPACAARRHPVLDGLAVVGFAVTGILAGLTLVLG